MRAMAEQFRTVLCPVDFDELAASAIKHASEIAARNGAHLCVLHVSPLEPNSWDFGVEKRLEALARTHLERRPSDRFIVRNGNAANQIIATAKELQVDLIVMPAHGRKDGLKRFILGSVAEHVLRNSPVPVLTIPASCSRPD